MTATRRSVSRDIGRVAEAGRDAKPIALVYLYAVWAVTVFDLHYFFGNVVARPLGYLGTAVYAPLLVMILVRIPMIMAWAKGWVWFPQYLLLLIPGFITLPAAANTGFARNTMQYLLVYYVLAIATAVYVRTARAALPILVMMASQFAWWAVSGGTSGAVWWHPWLSNFDAFGGIMAMGAGMCFWLGRGARRTWLRTGLYALAAYCVLGVVASNARGAFLALVAVGGLVWLRSPRKLATGATLVVAIAIVFVSATLLFPEGAFWQEIRSVFHEGTESGTGGARWALWSAGFEVFKERPVFGIGAGNFGAFASTFIPAGSIEAIPNPGTLYGKSLHNAYMQILTEFGAVGALGFAWMLVDFHQRNLALLRPEAAARWAERTGGAFRLRDIGLALEAAHVATILTSAVYATLLSPRFFTLWAANRAIWAVTCDTTAEHGLGGGGRPPRLRASVYK